MADATRFEARDRCERLIRRLENATRVGGKKRVDVFDVGRGEEEEGVRRFMEGWVKRKVKEEGDGE